MSFLDAHGNTVTNLVGSVVLSITNGTGVAGAALGGSLTQPAVAGVATFADLTLDKAGAGYTLTATTSGLTSATSSAFTVSVGVAAKLAFTVQPSAVASGSWITPAVQVTVQDAQGNPVTSSTASVTLAITSGTGTSSAVLGGTKTMPAVNGVASFEFSALTVDKVGTGYTLTASSPSLTSATSSAFAVTPGAAAKLAFTVQPSSVGAGTAINPAVQVAVQDAQGNTATSASPSITLAIASGTGTAGAVLGGTLTVAAVSGVTTFSDLTIDKAGTGYTLRASRSGLTTASSSAFAVTAGAAAAISRNGGDSQVATAGTAVPQAPSAKVVDAYGNPVSGVAVTFAIATGGGSVTGADQTTGASGVSTVGSWTLGPAAGTNTLTATSAGLSGSPITFTATAKDPPTTCGQTAFLTIGAARDGNLVSSPCFISPTMRLGVGSFTGPEPGGTHFYDAYLLDIPANTITRITVTRGTLPVYAILLGYDLAGAPISHAYNAPLVLNNSTAATVRYQVLVTTYVAGDTGTYSILTERL